MVIVVRMHQIILEVHHCINPVRRAFNGASRSLTPSRNR
jgi:hypothetical protein